MLEVNGEIERMVELLGAARTEMVTQLAAAMAIIRDARLRQRLGEIAGVDLGQDFLIGQLSNQSWLKVGGHGYTIDRKRQTGLSIVDLDEVLRTLPEFEQSLQDSMQRTNATNSPTGITEANVGHLSRQTVALHRSGQKRARLVQCWLPKRVRLGVRRFLRKRTIRSKISCSAFFHLRRSALTPSMIITRTHRFMACLRAATSMLLVEQSRGYG